MLGYACPEQLGPKALGCQLQQQMLLRAQGSGWLPDALGRALTHLWPLPCVLMRLAACLLVICSQSLSFTCVAPCVVVGF